MQTSQIKESLSATLKKLTDNLGRIPDAYDWAIYSGENWWDYFSSWSRFLHESGVTDDWRTVSPEPGEEKIIALLKILEQRAGRPISRIEWRKSIDGINGKERNSPAYRKYYGLNGRVDGHRWHSLRWDIKDYVMGYDCDTVIEYRDESCWLSFRYAAGLNNYTREELLALGVGYLRDSILSRGPSGLVQIKPVIHDKRYLCICPNVSLPHLAIYDQFGTLKNYTIAIVDEYRRTIQAKDSTTTSVNPRQEDDPEVLLDEINLLISRLSKKLGKQIKIQIAP